MKAKAKKPTNAADMSKTALIAEVRRLRKSLRKSEDETANLRQEIRRRDNATAHFNEMAAEKSRIVALMLPYEKRKRELMAEHGRRVGFLSEEPQIFEAISSETLATFWGGILYEKAMDELDRMAAISEADKGRAIVKEAMERLEQDAAKLPKEGA